MKVKVRTMRRQGQNLNRDEMKLLPPRAGELRIAEERDPALGRQVLRARLLDMTRGTENDILPGLMDARLVWAANGKMMLIGTERIDRSEYGQTWSVEVD